MREARAKRASRMMHTLRELQPSGIKYMTKTPRKYAQPGKTYAQSGGAVMVRRPMPPEAALVVCCIGPCGRAAARSTTSRDRAKYIYIYIYKCISPNLWVQIGESPVWAPLAGGDVYSRWTVR
jgi:hypothetical protein